MTDPTIQPSASPCNEASLLAIEAIGRLQELTPSSPPGKYAAHRGLLRQLATGQAAIVDTTLLFRVERELSKHGHSTPTGPVERATLDMAVHLRYCTLCQLRAALAGVPQ